MAVLHAVPVAAARAVATATWTLLLAAHLAARTAPQQVAEPAPRAAPVPQVAATAPQTTPAPKTAAPQAAAPKVPAAPAPTAPKPAPRAPDAPDAQPAAAKGGAAATPVSGAAVLGRVVVLGASASNGINLPGSFAEMLGGSIAAAHEAPLDVTSVLFFMQGDGARGQLVKRAQAHDPTALVGLDFLFWYGYGDVPEEARLPLLEQGLAILDGFRCPVVISEFPDMSPAVGLMLQASQMPAPGTLTKLNARLREWAQERPNVIVVPLSQAIEAMRAGKEIKVGAHTWPAGAEGRFLQKDKLHPTAEGLVIMACLVNEGLRAHVPGLQAADFVADPAAILAAYVAVTKDRKPRAPF